MECRTRHQARRCLNLLVQYATFKGNLLVSETYLRDFLREILYLGSKGTISSDRLNVNAKYPS